MDPKRQKKPVRRGHGPAPNDERAGAEGEDVVKRLQSPYPGEAEDEAGED